MTEELFREDATLTQCEAPVCSPSMPRGILLDRTVFYPQGGGQAGDAGLLPGRWPRGAHRRHAEGKHRGRRSCTCPRRCRRWRSLARACAVTAVIDWQRRRRHMRFHTATHLLCALVPHPVDGCSITPTMRGWTSTRPSRSTRRRSTPAWRAWWPKRTRSAPLDQRGRTRRQSAARAQHERAAAARTGPRARAGGRERGSAALRRHARGQHARHRPRRGHEDREEEREDAPGRAGLCR